MSRPLLPPDGIWVPSSILYDTALSPVVRDTWIRLRGLAWGKSETPPVSLEQLCELFKMSRSSLYGHMLILKARAACQWRAVGGKTIIVSFPDGCGEQSRFSDLPTLSLSESKPKNTVGGAGVPKSKNSDNLKKSEKTPTPAAVSVFRSIARRYPDKAVWPQITAAVGESPDSLDRWGRTIEGWIAAGFYKLNVGGMLDWYAQGRTSKAGPVTTARPAANGNGNGRLPDGV